MADGTRFGDSSPERDWVPTDVYDPKGAETNCLVLNYTMACPLRCDFCCYSCHSGRTSQTMPREHALRLVEEAAALDVFSCVGFTGGEPLLFLDDVVAVSRKASELGMGTTVATACHWAESAQRARSVVDSLVDSGLRRINISHDPSHAKFVPSDNVLHAVDAAVARSVDVYVVGTFTTIDQRLEDMLPAVVGQPNVHLLNKYVAKVGRAARRDITQSSYGYALTLENLACYRRVYHDVVVFWDGRTYPCCSTFNRSTPGLVVGNAFREPLASIWHRIEGSLMLRIMKRQGFAELYRLLESREPGIGDRLPRVEDSIGPCSLCHSIFSDRDLEPEIKDIMRGYEAERADATLEMMIDQLGEGRTRQIIDSILATTEMNDRDTAETSGRDTVLLPDPFIRTT